MFKVLFLFFFSLDFYRIFFKFLHFLLLKHYGVHSTQNMFLFAFPNEKKKEKERGCVFIIHEQIQYYHVQYFCLCILTLVFIYTFIYFDLKV